MSAGRCLDDGALAEFVRGRGGDEDEAHVSRCEICSRRVALLRRVAARGLNEIANATAQVDELIARLLTTKERHWHRLLLEPEYHRADVVRRLFVLAVQQRLHHGRRAAALARAATRIIDLVQEEGEDVAELTFEVWKLASNILREQGDYTGTAVALKHAEDAASRTSDPELALASVRLSRVLLYIEPDIWQPKEAAFLLDTAEGVFKVRDPARLDVVLTTKGMLLDRSGELREARTVFESILARIPDRGERYLDALSNVAWVRIRMLDASTEVERLVETLLHENTARERAVQAARARWMMGRICLLRAEYETAVMWLKGAIPDISDRDAALRIRLDWIETLLLAEHYSAALELSRHAATLALALDRDHPTRRRALTTEVFTYLREAAQRQVLTADIAAECARYMDQITYGVPVKFIPPLPLTAVN